MASKAPLGTKKLRIFEQQQPKMDRTLEPSTTFAKFSTGDNYIACPLCTLHRRVHVPFVPRRSNASECSWNFLSLITSRDLALQFGILWIFSQSTRNRIQESFIAIIYPHQSSSSPNSGFPAFFSNDNRRPTRPLGLGILWDSRIVVSQRNPFP